MSYILEALRKADAERERGSVPDLHAQLLPSGAAQVQAEAPRASLLPWLAVGVLLAIVAGGAWFAIGRDAPVAVVMAPPVAASAAVAPAASAAEAVASAAAASAAMAAAPRSAAAPPPTPKSKTAAVRRPPPAKSAKAAAPAPADKALPARVPTLSELPGELRQQVPQLAIGGSVYSPQASARMVIVNGQVFQEGSSLAPALKLEQIRQKAAVFSIQGQLFELPL